MAGALVTVATFGDPVEAANSREVLDSNGFHAVLEDRDLGAVAEDSAVCFTTLRVPAEEASRAREILDALWKLRPEDSEARRAMTIALVGMVLPPLLFYSLWSSARLLPRWRDLSLRDRRCLKFAVVANLSALVAVAACVLYWTL